MNHKFSLLYFFLLFTAAAAASVFGTVIFALTSIYMHHYNHINLTSFKFNLTINVISSTRFIIYFSPIFCSKFTWLIWCTF